MGFIVTNAYHHLSPAHIDHELIKACISGQFDMVKYITTDPELPYRGNIKANEQQGLNLACYHGHLDIVQFLLTSNELKNHCNIHAHKERAFLEASSNNKLNVVKYLVSNFKINFKIDNHKAFRTACILGHLDIINYFLFELNIQINKKLKTTIQKEATKPETLMSIMALIFKKEFIDNMEHNLKIKAKDEDLNKL